MNRRPRNTFLMMVVAIFIIIFIALNLLWWRGNAPAEPAPASTTPPTVWQNTTAMLPAPTQITAAKVTAVEPLVARAPAIQVTEPPPRPNVPPDAIPGDCNSWQAIFRWYGATDEEIYFFFVSTPWGRKNVIYHESMCGLRFRNPDTSDTGICQLNGVHRDWMWNEFHLRVGSGVTEYEASSPRYAMACLRLLRGENNTPNEMKYACAWRPGRFCS